MKRLKQRSQKFVAIFLFVIAGIAVSAEAQNKPIAVGVITALSGRMATIGTAVRNGIELAHSERPELFGNISLTYEDDQFDGKQSVTAYKKLREADHAAIIFGFGDTLGQVVGHLAELDHVVLINFNFDASSAVGKQFVVRAMNHTRQYMGALSKYLLEQGDSQFSIVRVESPFFNAMEDSFRSSVGTRGAVNEIAAYNPTDTDFRPSILKLKNSNSTAVGLFLSPDQLIEFMKQAGELRLNRRFFGTDLFETAAGLPGGKGLFDGCLYPDNDVSPEFRERYGRKYGNDSQLTFAGSGYDMAILIGEQLAGLKAVDSAALIHSLSEVHNRRGVLGEFSFTNDRDFGMFFEYPIRVKRIKGSVGVAGN